MDPATLVKSLDSDSRKKAFWINVYNAFIQWYRGDFGGQAGIIDLLKKYDVLPEDAHPEIEYKAYDWTLALENYVE
jgi:hypothetical protein